MTFTYSVPYSGDPAGTCTSHVNTARITDDQQPLASASKTVEVCVGADLAVSTTAEPSSTDTFSWGISKGVDTTSQTVAQGDAATFDYAVKVTRNNGTDSWETTGTIHVSNPNDWEAVTADVTDAVDNGGVCTVTGGGNVSIPASGSVDLPYVCTYASAPSPQEGTDSATAGIRRRSSRRTARRRRAPASRSLRSARRSSTAAWS
jgi:large repetitive protein